MGDLKQMKKLQQIFIDAEDWEEVSKIQYEIDSIEEFKVPKIEPWFRLALLQYGFRMLDTWASEILWIGKKLENIEKEKKNV